MTRLSVCKLLLAEKKINRFWSILMPQPVIIFTGRPKLSKSVMFFEVISSQNSNFFWGGEHSVEDKHRRHSILA